MKQLLVALALCLSSSVVALAADDVPGATTEKQSMVEMVHAWYRVTGQEFNDKGEAGLPSILALVHEDIRYLHPEFDADYDRDLLIDGFKRRLQRASTRGVSDTITNVIAGKNMVVTERKTTFEKKTESGWEKRSQDQLVTLFEFKDGKIWRITEYWN